MIRINLLGISKPKKGKRAAIAMPSMAGDGPSILVVLLVVGLLTAGGNYYWFWRLNSQHDKILADIQSTEEEAKRLAQVKVAFLEKQKQADQYKRRFDVIDQLKSTQAGPVKLLAMMGETVNTTDAVWLSNMTDDGSSISVNGIALSHVAVANLMSNLKKTKYFKSVEIKETQQNEAVKDMQAFVFTLICEKQKS
ncbi:MAG TPA: PilN domain-containing protein [Clostridia bacterium]|nr:PilN domain-containing protein [Clostridia bacterium]